MMEVVARLRGGGTEGLDIYVGLRWGLWELRWSRLVTTAGGKEWVEEEKWLHYSSWWQLVLVAEAWDCGGLYQVGMFPHWGIWSEWNGKYRDIVRQYIKGTDGFAGAFAECLCGSPNLYQEGGRKPWNSINFVCAHDGFSLADLVMYNNKHNLANGEDNNDGENHNNSWNCGQEGEFANIPVKKLRKRQMRNFFLCLMVSQDKLEVLLYTIETVVGFGCRKLLRLGFYDGEENCYRF